MVRPVNRKLHLGTLAPSDPVALHRLDFSRPVDPIKLVQQLVSVIGDLKEPLLHLLLFDLATTAPALAALNLFVS